MQYIYGLQDPIDKRIKYVGKSNTPERRLLQHIGTNEDTTKGRWIQSLRSMGKQPSIVILATCEDDQVFYHENWWILMGRRQGWELTNSTTPGEWRAGDDFKTMFALELQAMYKEHQDACERLNEQTAKLTMERAAVALEAKTQARIKKASDITYFAVYGFVALFVTFGMIQLVLSNLEYTHDSSVYVRWLITILWCVQYYMIYAHYTIRKLDPSVSSRLGYHVMFGAMAICDIFGGTVALIEIGRMSI